MLLKHSTAIILLLLLTSFEQKNDIETWNFNQLESYINSRSDNQKLTIINFWATWCAPCIKEMPYFEEANNTFKNQIEVLLVSLDFYEELNPKVIPFLEKKKIKTKVVLLTDSDYNEWIDKINKSWTGAIPATLMILPDGKKMFYEGEFEKEELFSIIEDFIPKK